ncbi:hypothetical protein EP331_00180 [bacterium]|nr:MAG: hypothetical protein EP331_00180 [bacterium]
MSSPYYRALMNRNMVEFLFDVYPSTVPSISFNKCLKSSFVGADFITIVKDDGSTYPEDTFGFLADGSLDTASILSFLGTDTGLVKKAVCHNTSDYYEQNTMANMPIIAESGTINTDSGGRIALKYSSTKVMSMPSSLGLFNSIHDGTVCSQVFEFERFSGTTRSYVFVNRPAAGTVGFFVGAGTFFSVANRLSYRIESPAGQAWYSTDSGLTDDNDHTVFSTVDVTNATASERIVNFIDGTESKTNTQTGTTTPSTSNASFNITMGSIVSGFEFVGNISSGIFFEEDQRANRTDILTYL